MRVVVCLKQTVDPLIPVTSLVVDRDRKRIATTSKVPPVLNGYDEQALEAALRLKDTATGGCEVIALSAAAEFDLDVMRSALAVGTDDLVLVQDPALETWDAHSVARVLAAAIRHLEGVDLVLCGRQASDWDNAQVPLMLAEMMPGVACLTLARKVEALGRRVRVERVLSDGIQIMEADLPAVVTVTSELGTLRYPRLKDKLQAARRRPRYLTLQELGIDPVTPPAVELLDLELVATQRACELVTGSDGAEAGRRLEGVLRGARLI